MNKIQNKAQVTIFVIVALVIVGVISLFFVFKDNLLGNSIPQNLAPVYDRYSECINQEATNGISLLQSQGGRINIGELTSASDFSPFSTHLNFLGFKIPYWYGITQNNLIVENIPSVNDMEDELAQFIESRVNDCDFSDFYSRGFSIQKSEVKADVTIEDNSIIVSVESPLSVSLDEDTSVKTNHDVNLDSKLGSLHKAANSIYNYERSSLFLENYALDVLQSYAPVDGVEIQCSPKIWQTGEVVSQIKQGLNANIGAIGFRGSSSKEQYFTVQNSINENVNIIYLPEAFPSKIEVTPASQALMIAEPVGTQEGLGIMGFCYVPYHFIYDLRFPVLIQVGDGLNNFQFPMVIDIDNNVVSQPNVNPIVDEVEVDVCSFAEGDVTIKTYDSNLNPVSANVTYSCFDSSCDLGQTILSGDSASIDAKIPLCVNGQLIAKAQGYADSEILFSSNSNSFAELILEKEYPIDVEVRLGGKEVRNVTAVIHFVGLNDYSTSAIIPEVTEVNLKEGLYTIEAFVYGNSNVIIPSSRKTECFNVNKGGIAGIFGATKEECVDVEIPATKIDYALKGGGKLTDYYILESELEQGKIVIDVSELPAPNTLEQLQYNYEVFSTLGLEVSFE